MTVMAEPKFVAESVAALRAAPDYAELHRIFAERAVALIFDAGTMHDLRRLAAAWRRRNHQLLAESLEGEQP